MSILTKIIVTSVTLAPLIAAGAAYGQASGAATDSHDVRVGDRVIGRDPDPFIRGEIQRHYGLGYK